MKTTLLMPNRDPHLWKQAKARVGFRMHLNSYLIVNAGLWLLWAFSNFAFRSITDTASVYPWPIFPMLGWGIGLASHYFHVYRGSDQRAMIEEEYQKLTRSL